MSTQTETPNILLIIADDLGQDVVNITGMGTSRAIEVHTNDGTVDIIGALTNASRLLRNGLFFGQAWAQPACSPTRASIYTGLHPWKSGVGSPMGTPELDASGGFSTLPTLLPNDYVSGLFGKWHLGSVAGTRPTDHGWNKHVGTLGGVIPDYFNWSISDSDTGYVASNTTDYATQRTVKEAAAWINAQDPATPWFATIAFHSPHDPFHVPPGGYDTATLGNPSSDDYKFNVMAQNMDANIGRLLGTSGVTGGALYFDPIPEDQLSNTLIIFIGDNGSPAGIALDEEKTQISEGGVRIPMIIADGQAVVKEINGELIVPRFLDASKLNRITPLMAHVVDLYMTIVRLVDPSANAFPSDTDSKDFSTFIKRADSKIPIPPKRNPNNSFDPLSNLPPFDIPKPVRTFNFSQWYASDGTRATIRNTAYKLNYDDNPAVPDYRLYLYSGGEIPNREDDGSATDLFGDALSGVNPDAQVNLNLLLDELIANYQRDETRAFPDPR